MDRPPLARTAAGMLLTLMCALAPGASAQVKFGSESLPLKSDNVTPLLTLPVGNPIGARFRDPLRLRLPPAAKRPLIGLRCA